MRRLVTRQLMISLGLLAALAGCRTSVVVRAPSQPASGPGGSDYAHGDVLSQRLGVGGDEDWIFQPDNPRPQEAPVVVFMHGWGGTDPAVYGAWIRHLVRKGNVVIYPRYQDRLSSPISEMTDATIRAVTAALARLAADGPVRPSGDHIAWIGHSLGGIIAANLSATFASNGLPPPAVLMAVAPGGESRLPVGDLSGMPTDMLVLLVVGDADRNVGDTGALAIQAALGHMPSENLGFVTVRSDAHFSYSFSADHFAPLAAAAGFPPYPSLSSESTSPAAKGGWFAQRRSRRVANRYAPDALDFFAYWKLSEGLLDAAFRGQNRNFALGNTADERFMGTYSDGTPLAPLEVGQ